MEVAILSESSVAVTVPAAGKIDTGYIQGAEQGHIQHVEPKGPDAGMDVESDKGRELGTRVLTPAWLRFCVHITRPKTKGLRSLRSLHPEGPRVRSAYTEE